METSYFKNIRQIKFEGKDPTTFGLQILQPRSKSEG